MKGISCCLLLLAGCSQASPPATPSEASAPTAIPAPPTRDCAQESRLARNIMLARQTGASMEESMAVAKGDAFIRQLVVDAYDEPHYATPEMQQREAGDFADKAMLTCEKGE